MKSLLLGCMIAVTWASVMQAQDKFVAPVPVQIAKAKKVFLANGGMDSKALVALRSSGSPNRPYNEFYAAMKKWGRYELVSTPADADLVFELRFVAPLIGCNVMDEWSPQLTLKIVDARSHFTLWTLNEPVGGALRKATWIKNFDQGIANLTTDVKKLAGK